jgi:quercetin dioxygenase-like cupin family protein
MNYKDIEAKPAEEGASKLKVRWLITKEIGANNFAMRLFEMEPGGNSPLHQHPYEHEVYILEGEGIATDGEQERKFKPRDAILILPNERHQLKNTGKKTVKFLCLIPYGK